MRPLPIRWQITLWITAAFAIVLCSFGYFVFSQLRITHYEQLDQNLQRRYEAVIADKRLGSTPRRRLQGWIAQFGEHASISGLLIDDDGVVVATAGPISDITDPAVPPDLSETPAFDTVSPHDLGRMRRLSVIVPDDRQQMTAMMVTSLSHMDEELATVAQILVITIPLTLILAAVLAYGLAFKALAPVAHLRQMADEITAEHLDRRLPVRNPHDELGHLAQTINSMIARLEASFEEIRRFTGDASHELRTPITVIRSEAELGAQLASANPDSQNRFESIVEECTRLAVTTAQLLTLSRGDAGVTQPNWETIELNPFLAEIVATMQPLATANHIQLSFSPSATTTVVLSDRERLRQVLDNLIENAVKYTPNGGSVQVVASTQADAATITIEDTGIGISPEHLPRIFDRFYRVNKDCNANSGAGLGLSIVSSIAKTLNLRIDAESVPGSGSCFTVSIPLHHK